MSPPAVVLVHGVGVGPGSLRELSRLVGEAGYRAVVVHRPGYGDAADVPPAPVDEQVEQLAGLVSRTRPAAVIGVSGGATLAVLLAVRLASSGSPPVPILAHEPLIGPLAPALHGRVARAVAALPEPATAAAATGFLRGLVGDDTWSRLDPAERRFAAARPDVVATEARRFAAVAPSAAELVAVRRRGSLTTTIGSRGGPGRRGAAGVLRSLAGAAVTVVPGAGHLAHVDAPEAFATIALSVVRPAGVDAA